MISDCMASWIIAHASGTYGHLEWHEWDKKSKGEIETMIASVIS